MLPLLAFLAFVWFERRYLQIIYYDFTSQLEPQHRVYNLLWCACPASCGPRAPHTSRPADLAPCRPRALQTSPPSERPAGLAQASHQSVDATGGVGLLLQPEDLHRSSSLAGDACRRADNAYQQRAAPLLLPPQHPRVHRLGASLGHSPGRCRLPLPVRPLEANMRALTAPLAECTAHTRCACAAQVRWLHGVWLVWRKPRDLAARGKMP